VVLVENVTFHTAGLRWFVSPRRTDVINGSYRISVHGENDASNSSNITIRTSFYSVPIAVDVRDFSVLLTQLDQDTTYMYSLGIISDTKTIDNAHQGSFRTSRYREWVLRIS
jgi:hypothetical protein